MPAVKDVARVERPTGHDSDSDEAPDVVTNQNAMETMFTQRREETAAREHAKSATKRKRKSRQETEVPELPDDVLLAVAARNAEEEGTDGEKRETMEKEEKEAGRTKRRERTKRGNVAKLVMQAQKTHTRQFGNIYVQKLETLETTQTREVSDSAREFLKLRTAPMRQRMNVLEGHSSLFTKKQKYHSQQL